MTFIMWLIGTFPSCISCIFTVYGFFKVNRYVKYKNPKLKIQVSGDKDFFNVYVTNITKETLENINVYFTNILINDSTDLFIPYLIYAENNKPSSKSETFTLRPNENKIVRFYPFSGLDNWDHSKVDWNLIQRRLEESECLIFAAFEEGLIPASNWNDFYKKLKRDVALKTKKLYYCDDINKRKTPHDVEWCPE